MVRPSTAARDAGAKRVAVALPDGARLNPADAAEAAAEAALLATYRFTTYYGTARKDDPALKEIDAARHPGWRRRR